MFFYRIQLMTRTFVLIVISMLFGCTGHKEYYQKQGSPTHPMVVPKDVGTHPTEPFYPVPGVPTPKPAAAPTTAPSIVPPGSHLERFQTSSIEKNNNPLQTPNSQTAISGNTIDHGSVMGHGSLIVNTSFHVTWNHLAHLLSQSPYKILDQDQELGSFYILDKVATENKIEKDTPIYRVYLKETTDTHKTEIVLLDQHNQPPPEDVSQRILGFMSKNF